MHAIIRYTGQPASQPASQPAGKRANGQTGKRQAALWLCPAR
ncbi:hypothetical protein [Rhodoferax sp.]|nr:hypothetical protein [Rhodoferax sp.]MDD5480436.1 hypothetical protein [Rhodoferax sp.]